MKKVFYLATMLVALMVGATSCQDENSEKQLAGDGTVSFTLNTLQANAPSTISNGKTVDRLVYVIYDAAGNIVQNEAQDMTVRDNVTFPTTETVNLVKGQTYKMVFWAQNMRTDAYDVYLENNDLKVKVNYQGTNNAEERDAFTAVKEFKVEGAMSVDVELTRPLAQVNVGVTKQDWYTAQQFGIDIDQSAIVIEKAAKKINLLTGKVAGYTDVSYSLANIPQEALYVDEDGDGMREAEYIYLSMSYILVPQEKSTLDKVAVTFQPAQGEPITITEGLTNVPVQRNWRTNILGTMLTSNVNINISIDPDYDGDYIHPEFETLQEALNQGGTVTIYKDLVFDNSMPLVIPQGADVVLDMNGHKLINNVQDKYAIHNEGKLTIKNGIFDNLAPNTFSLNNAVIRNSGELIIEGGVFGSKNTYGRAIDNRAAGKVTINGGTFDVASRPEVALYVITHRSTETMIINNANIHTQANGIFATTLTDGATESGELIVNGGSYTLDGANSHYMVYAPVPSKVTLNGGTYTWYKGDNPNAAIWNKDDNGVEQGVINISSACKRLGDEPWVNYIPNIAVVESAHPMQLKDAMESGASVVKLTQNVVGGVTTTSMNDGHAGVVVNGQTLDGQGNTLNINSSKNSTHDCVIFTNGGTIKDLTVNGQMRGIYSGGLQSDLIIDKVVIDAVGYTINISTTTDSPYKIIATNSTFNGWTSYSDRIGSAEFTNCKFGKGTANNELFGVNPSWEAYATLRPHATTILKDCDFEAGFELELSLLKGSETITLDNCTVEGTPITDANISSLLSPDSTLDRVVLM